MKLFKTVELIEGEYVQYLGTYVLNWPQYAGDAEIGFVEVNDPLIKAAHLLLEACKNEVIQLANLASMTDPNLTKELMTFVYAAIAAAEEAR